MRMLPKASFAGAILVAGLAASPTLYAHGSNDSQRSMMGSGMMGQGMMGGMMNMMGQMSGMMEHCNGMMQSMMGEHGAQRPNEQWRNRQHEPQHQPQQQGRNG